MSRTEKSIFTNMCMVYDNNGNVLVQKRVDPDWSGVAFPGGHVEKEEPLTDAVIREVYEETGLVITEPQICGIKDWIREDGTRYIVHLYKTNRFQGTLVSSDEGDVYWVSLEDLKREELAAGMDSTLKIFFDEKISEQFLSNQNGEWVELLK